MQKGEKTVLYALHTGEFAIEYTESRIDHSVLWESHCHAQYEMIGVVEGDISIMLEGRSYRLTAQETVIIPPLSYHTITANAKGAYRRITALFDLAAIPDVLQEQFRKKTPTDTAIFYSSKIDELKRICKESSPTFYRPLAHSLMIGILYHDTNAEPQAVIREDKTATDAFLRDIISYIDAHLCEKISLEDLARHTARSKSSVCHLFEKTMHVSPKQYILKKKLALADKWIRDGLPPTLAAMRIGYDNYSDFYRIYRKQFGMSPTKGKE